MIKLLSRTTLSIALLVATLLPPTAHAVLAELPDSLPTLAPEQVHRDTLSDINKALRYGHYRKRTIDNQFSSELLDAYLNRLDRHRLYFLASDIAEFEQHRDRLDEALRNKDLSAGFFIFNRYQQRTEERIRYMLDQIEQGLTQLDFGRDEEMQTDRKEAAWAHSAVELDNLWRQRLKSAVLNFKLSDKTLEEAAEILSKRYRNQLHRLYQTNADDAFQVYANTLTSLYGPHTQYFSPRRTENFNIDMRLSLEGIGAVLQSEDENTKVVRLIPGGPAAKSGVIGPADVIVGVAQGNDELVDVVGWRLDEVVDLIRGPKGSVVRLEVVPAGSDAKQTKLVSITRNEVKLEEQAASKSILQVPRNGETRKIGVISIPTFYIDFNALRNGDPDYRSTTRDVRRLLDQLIAEGAEGLVIDLRNNGGGSLKEAVDLAGLFIPQGPVVQIKDSWGRIRVEFDHDPTYYDIPLVVMVNRLSASASEIFAGAIKDYDRGLIVGNQTFGKGTVQALHPLDFGQLKLTQATFYRVSGVSTQHKGVLPHLQYPSVYDPDEVGESTQEGALPWDEVKPLPHRRYPPLTPLLSNLELAHNRRAAMDPDLIALSEGIEEAQRRQRDTLPLQEERLRALRKDNERWRLELENRRRAAKNLEPLTSVAELEQASTGTAHSSRPAEEDALIRESGEVLIDLLDSRMLSRQQ
ncbi:carboxy terminal-processing peptidase [Motiliproteus sediminis]|uniref:carboxy terminal-processing peptidase n=1 Tax=Motiliproteus sediminis TaxID=1468178 RepID=UPI001AEFAB4C